MRKLPSMQFYPGDWLKDPAVRSVSLEARGLWIDMLCLMHESGRRGFLQHATGKPVTADQLARMTGCSTDEVSRLLQELENSGVFSCTEHGVIYNRRMVHDEQFRMSRVENGKKGGRKPQEKTYGKPTGKPTQNLNQTPSSSSSEYTPSVPCGTSSPGGEARAPHKIRFGKHVLMTAEERQKLGELFGEETAERYIERLNLYAEQKPARFRQYGSHYATLVKWSMEDREKNGTGEANVVHEAPKATGPTRKEIEEYRALLEANEEVQEQFRESVIDPLREELQEASWEQWIRPLLVVKCTDGVLVLFHEQARFVQENYGKRIQGKTTAKMVKVTSEMPRAGEK